MRPEAGGRKGRGQIWVIWVLSAGRCPLGLILRAKAEMDAKIKIVCASRLVRYVM